MRLRIDPTRNFVYIQIVTVLRSRCSRHYIWSHSEVGRLELCVGYILNLKVPHCFQVVALLLATSYYVVQALWGKVASVIRTKARMEADVDRRYFMQRSPHLQSPSPFSLRGRLKMTKDCTDPLILNFLLIALSSKTTARSKNNRRRQTGKLIAQHTYEEDIDILSSLDIWKIPRNKISLLLTVPYQQGIARVTYHFLFQFASGSFD